MAEVSAVADPDIPPKNMLATILVEDSPPRDRPTKILASLIILSPMPPRPTMLPARMNSGIATIEKLSETAGTIRCGRASTGKPW